MPAIQEAAVMTYPGLTLANAKPRPNAEVLREYQAYPLANNPAFERLYAPERRYRWLVQLDCGCITEALTEGEDHLPTDGVMGGSLRCDYSEANQRQPTRERTFLIAGGLVRCTNGCPRGWCYPKGYLWCSDHDEDKELPWREVVRWIKRGDECPTSVVDGTVIGPYVSWTVELSCGHCGHLTAESDWIPEWGHRQRPEVTAKLKPVLEGQRAELAAITDPGERRILKRSIDWNEAFVRMGAAEPWTEEQCAHCQYQRRIVGSRPVGWLAHPKAPKPPRKPRSEGSPKPPSRLALTRQLNKAEANAEMLRKQLAEAEAEAERLRRERDEHI
jgi:hypothetical protein